MKHCKHYSIPPDQVLLYVSNNLFAARIGVAILEIAGRQPVFWPNIAGLAGQLVGSLGPTRPTALKQAWNTWLRLTTTHCPPQLKVSQYCNNHRFLYTLLLLNLVAELAHFWLLLLS